MASTFRTTDTITFALIYVNGFGRFMGAKIFCIPGKEWKVKTEIDMHGSKIRFGGMVGIDLSLS